MTVYPDTGVSIVFLITHQRLMPYQLYWEPNMPTTGSITTSLNLII